MGNGHHLILDLYGCDPDVLDDYAELQDALETALLMSNAKILQIIGEKFKPYGVTLLALLSESHASIHTWPEIGYCAIDLYTCGKDTDNEKAECYLRNKLMAGQFEKKEIVRSTTPVSSV